MATRDIRLASELVRRLTTRVPLTSPLRDFEERLMATHPMEGFLVPLVTRLFDPGLDPGWLEPLWPSTQLVIVTAATGLGGDGWLRRRLVSRLRRFRTELPPVPPTRPGPSRLRTPFAAFHYYMWRRASTRQPTPYVAVAGLVHLRARALEHGMLAREDEFGPKLDDRRWDYLKAARVLCWYGPPPQSLTHRLRRSLIDACGFDD